MIIRENYEEEHIRELQSKSRRDPQLIERALYAMGLLEALTKTGMKFIFKGGSCLMVLLPRLMRLSTDIDIIVDPGTDVKEYICMSRGSEASGHMSLQNASPERLPHIGRQI